MESPISHNPASLFTAHPKGYPRETPDKLLVAGNLHGNGYGIR
jgi:hypothetical protein